MSALPVGYARCSTEEQDLTAQRDGLAKLGVEPERVYVDSMADRPEPGTPRAAGGAGRLLRRRHPGGDETGPAGPVPARGASSRRPVQGSTGSAARVVRSRTASVSSSTISPVRRPPRPR